jgi:hypothetical protein
VDDQRHRHCPEHRREGPGDAAEGGRIDPGHAGAFQVGGAGAEGEPEPGLPGEDGEQHSEPGGHEHGAHGAPGDTDVELAGPRRGQELGFGPPQGVDARQKESRAAEERHESGDDLFPQSAGDGVADKPEGGGDHDGHGQGGPPAQAGSDLVLRGHEFAVEDGGHRADSHDGDVGDPGRLIDDRDTGGEKGVDGAER